MNEWKKRCAEKSVEKVLKTIDHIMDDSNGHLDDTELDELKDCWKILCMAWPHANGMAK